MGSKEELLVLALSSQIMTRRKDQKGKKCVMEINDISEDQKEIILPTCGSNFRKATYH